MEVHWGGATPKCVYDGGSQLWNSGILESHSCRCLGFGGGDVEVRSSEGLRQLASANVKTCGAKPSEICSGSVVALWATGEKS